MKTIVMKEAAGGYTVALDSFAVAQGPMVLRIDDSPVAVLISPADYAAFQAWQAERETSGALAAPPDFEHAVATFERLKPALLEQYNGRVVAVHDGRVVAVGDDRMAVLEMVTAQYGPVPCYIERVEPETPRRARISSAWIAR
ncbi:MAG: hypothetical protein FJ011_25925 [Chloroflexi bacterium]|nr:hypothetical protein [Chloroflexota bacterium]